MAESVGKAQPIFVDVGKKIEPPQLGDSKAEKTDVSSTSTDKQTGQDRIKCTECLRFTADTEEKMLRHVRKVHRGENPFQCSMCEYSTYNKAVFEEHVRVHQGIKPFKCSHCPYRSASKKNAKKHELIHRPNNPLKCPECPFIGRHYRGLKKHQMTHGSESAHQCKSCNATFKRSEQLEKHKEYCAQCRKKVCSAALEKHATRHMCARNPNRRQLFHCALCPWGSSSKPRILLHLIHHPRQVVPRAVGGVGVLTACGIPAGIP